MRGGSRLACLIAWTIAIAAVPTPAHADQVDELTALLSDSNAKTRLQATLSLARLGDKRTLRPLVAALKDPMPQVRTIAATALGKLGHKAAMPALKVAAADDHDPTVRDKAREAYELFAKANGATE